MKLAKLSLAAMVVAGLASSSFAESTTLADAFKNGKVNGELRAWYFDRDDGKTSEPIFNTGVDLTYVTDTLYGLSLGLTVQSNYAPFASTTAKTLYAGDEYGSGAALSEVYLAYTIGKTTAKLGRQYISTPLVNGSGSRMFKESFEGLVVVNTDLPNTTIFGGYVDKFQGRTSSVMGDDAGDAPTFKKSGIGYGLKNVGAKTELVAFEGSYTIGAINKSITNLTLTAQYGLVNNIGGAGSNDDLNLYYGEGNYVLPLSNMKVGFDAQYHGSDFDDDEMHINGNLYAGRISLSELAGFGASFAYSTTSKDDAVILSIGNGGSAYTAPLIAGAGKVASADTNAYKVELTYDLSKIGVAGLKVLANYVKINADNLWLYKTSVDNAVFSPTDFTYWAGQIAYDIPNLKGLTLSLEYEDSKADSLGTSTNGNEMRFRANYKF